MRILDSLRDAADLLFEIPDRPKFPNPDYKVPCRSCGKSCFWGKTDKWLLYENEKHPHLHQCPVNPLTE